MSFACDVNILLYASNSSSPFHPEAARFLAESASGDEAFCLTFATLLAYLRISTHPGIFPAPLSPDAARGNIDALASLPHVRFLGIESGFFDYWDRAAANVVVRGNLVQGAELVATMLQHGVKVLYTNDSDFRKFERIECRNPFAGAGKAAKRSRRS